MKKAFMLLCTALVMFSVTAVAQNVTVTGRITDASTGEGIPFAYVLLKNEKVGSMSDANGNYSITLPKEGILVYSSVGYHSAEVKVGTRRQIDIALSPDLELIDETVVIAYGTTTKKSFTGSAAVVSSDEIAKRVTSTVTNALAGTTPGVQVISSTGDPAAGGGAIRIRGIGSMSASSAPLYVVDGMPFDGDLSLINTNDIESMTVLKDAASNALYGARGANGVIMVTTKKGRTQSRFNLDVKWGVNMRAVKDYDYITDPALYYETHYNALRNYYLDSGYGDIDAYRKANANLTASAADGGLGYQVYTVPQGQNFIGVNGKDMDDSSVLLDLINTGAVGDTITLRLCRIESRTYKTTEFDVTLTLVEDKGNTTEATTEPNTDDGYYRGGSGSFEDFFRQYFGY